MVNGLHLYSAFHSHSHTACFSVSIYIPTTLTHTNIKYASMDASIGNLEFSVLPMNASTRTLQQVTQGSRSRTPTVTQCTFKYVLILSNLSSLPLVLGFSMSKKMVFNKICRAVDTYDNWCTWNKRRREEDGIWRAIEIFVLCCQILVSLWPVVSIFSCFHSQTGRQPSALFTF